MYRISSSSSPVRNSKHPLKILQEKKVPIFSKPLETRTTPLTRSFRKKKGGDGIYIRYSSFKVNSTGARGSPEGNHFFRGGP